MGYLSKEEYERREYNAEMKMRKNVRVAYGATDEQLNAIVNLCRIRHKFHCCDIYRACMSGTQESDYWNEFYGDKVNDMLSEVGLPIIDFELNILDWRDFEEWDILMDESERAEYESYEAFQDEVCCLMSNIKEKINDKIEEYLSKFDAEHGTSFAPTGALRVF